MSFVDRLRPELIRVLAPWRTLEATAEGLIALLATERLLPPEAIAAAVRAVLEREATQSTALLDVGAGVPHARIEGLSQTSVALAVARAGLYEPVPTVRVSIVALVLSPPDAVQDHLQTLASIATALRSPGLRAALLDAVDAVGAHRVLLAHATEPG